MRKYVLFLVAVVFLGFVRVARATIFGSARGIVHDPQHKPVAAADVKLHSATSDFSLAAQTDQNGEFMFKPVAVGDYTVTVSHSGFASARQNITVIAESSPVLHFPLDVGSVTETVTVSAQAEVTNIDSSTPTTLVNREDIHALPAPTAPTACK